jgi:hypothetical protein
MKRLTKKCGIITAVATLLLLTAMLIGCSNGTTVTEKENYTPPAGMGYVRLNFNNTVGRATTLPDVVLISFFKAFKLQFTPTATVAGGAAKTVTVTDSAKLGEAIDLIPGSYDLTVIAYTDYDDQTEIASNPAATGDATSELTIAIGVPESATVVLKLYDPSVGSGNGKFAWNITNSINSAISAASMVVTEIGGSVVYTHPSLLTAFGSATITGSTNIPAGYYFVDFSLTVGGKPRDFRHILHIYQNMTSTFGYEFSDGSFDITTGKVSSGITYEEPTVVSPPALSSSGALTENQTFPISLAAASGTPVDIIVTNFAIYDSIDWFVNFGMTALGAGLSASDTVDYDTLTIDGATAPFDTKGTYLLTVQGIKDGIPYGTFIRLEIDD